MLTQNSNINAQPDNTFDQPFLQTTNLGLIYSIEQIPGEQNVWADIVSRWRSPEPDAGFVFPSVEDIGEAQELARNERGRLTVELEEVDGVACTSGRPWIPTTATDLCSSWHTAVPMVIEE
ncbi:hypothetical protein L915_16284 [Phytophthora nicotianae]|uniref:Uncharacterized protein n=1 Tax=Phytophthora nicotianae TaxID=4792 RepID=W2G5D9_PHYNI|nr:hypothetical protein L915_16284 [Phytophthora nicotianae]